MIVVPLKPLANQNLKVTLNSQVCTIAVYQKGDYVFLDLALPSGPVLTGMLCMNRVLLVRQAYLGFVGDLAFVDLQGSDDPTGPTAYQQFYSPGGSGRFALFYLAPGDY